MISYSYQIVSPSWIETFLEVELKGQFYCDTGHFSGQQGMSTKCHEQLIASDTPNLGCIDVAAIYEY